MSGDTQAYITPVGDDWLVFLGTGASTDALMGTFLSHQRDEADWLAGRINDALARTASEAAEKALNDWAVKLDLYDEMSDPDPAWVAGIESARADALAQADRLANEREGES